jgi:hypothetical protein
MLVTASLACHDRNRDNLLVGESRKRVQEIIADNLSKAGWSWGCVSAIDSNGRTIWIADAHRDALARSWYRVRRLRPLRQGLLKLVLEAILDGVCDDILFSHDQSLS